MFIQIYIYVVDVQYKSLGCFKDTSDRAIPGRQGSVKKVEECYEIAKRLGYSVFALQGGHECWMSSTADKTYDKHGPCPSSCRANGLGGHWCMEVYQIQEGNYLVV